MTGSWFPRCARGSTSLKMVLFKEIRPYLEKQYQHMTPEDKALLTGAVVNGLFGVENMEKSVADFIADHQHIVQQELEAFAANFDHLKIPVTDALRTQYLCDSQEGIDSETVLEKARNLGILIQDRDIPLPGAFMSLVRSFGVAYKILEPMKRE